MALAVAQDNRLVFSADPEIGMVYVRHVPVLPVFPGAEHEIVPVGRDHGAVREPPLQRPFLVVAQRKHIQLDIMIGGIAKFDPVDQLVLVIPQARQRVRHHFVDDHRSVGHGDAFPVGPVAFLGVLKSRAEPGNVGKSVLSQAPAFIAGHDRVFAAVDQIGVRVIQIYGFAQAAQLELRVEGQVYVCLVLVVAVDDRPSVRQQRDRREQELDAGAVVAQAHALQVDLVV